MTNYQGAPLQEQVKKLLEQNLAYSKEIYEISKKTKRYILIGRIMSFIYLLLIIIPIILGVIYLPSFIRSSLDKILPAGINQPTDLDNSPGGIIDSYKDILKIYR